MKLNSAEKFLIAVSALLDVVQFAEVALVRAGLRVFPEWWPAAHAATFGVFGLIVAAAVALSVGGLVTAPASQIRTGLALCTVVMVTAVAGALVLGLSGASGIGLVAAMVGAQMSIYVAVPLAAALRSGPAVHARTPVLQPELGSQAIERLDRLETAVLRLLDITARNTDRPAVLHAPDALVTDIVDRLVPRIASVTDQPSGVTQAGVQLAAVLQAVTDLAARLPPGQVVRVKRVTEEAKP